MYKLRNLVGMVSNGKMLQIKGRPHGKEKLIGSDHMSWLAYWKRIVCSIHRMHTQLAKTPKKTTNGQGIGGIDVGLSGIHRSIGLDYGHE